MLDRIIRFFRFGRQDGEFELLETERGIPEFWGSAREEAPLPEQEDTRKVCKSLAENEERLRISFRADINSDLILRPFTLGGKIPAFLAYLNGMADTDQVSDFILRDGMRRAAWIMRAGILHVIRWKTYSQWARLKQRKRGRM